MPDSTTSTRSSSSRSDQLPACAACRHQRRKCTPNCRLAPHFPAERQKEFLNAHRLFGVRNISRILESMERPEERDIAAKCIIFQANMRATDPVGGCYRYIHTLQMAIAACHKELSSVLRQLAVCRAQNGRVQNDLKGENGTIDMDCFNSIHPLQSGVSGQILDYNENRVAFDETQGGFDLVDQVINDNDDDHNVDSSSSSKNQQRFFHREEKPALDPSRSLSKLSRIIEDGVEEASPSVLEKKEKDDSTDLTCFFNVTQNFDIKIEK